MATVPKRNCRSKFKLKASDSRAIVLNSYMCFHGFYDDYKNTIIGSGIVSYYQSLEFNLSTV